MDVLSGQSWTIWLTVLWLAPLAGFVIQILLGNKLPRNGDWVSIGGIGVSFAIAVLLFGNMITSEHGLQTPRNASWNWIPVQIASASAEAPEDHGDSETSHQQSEEATASQTSGDWSPGERDALEGINMGFYLDNLAILMLLVVTGVSLLVHIYSVGYMHDDPKYHRFFAFLNLFSFSMLGLVLVDNLIGLYIFWELVGVSSYLLIGFWFEKEDLGPAKASIKAFLTTRVGDIGMFIGILLIIFYLGTLNYTQLFDVVRAGGETGGFASHGTWTLAGIMLFLGAVGKSAQFPLHVWLPDAMEGPTPVSALIHAATMVAAGVYMVARLFPFFTSEALVVIAVVGGVTAMFAATIALVSDDIKQVLAYSTISQLGYMILALGSGAWYAGVLHLYTHAFFKALLFLCSGSVIHAVHTNDMWKMGGLKNVMPWTFVTMLIASLSISGVPLFSGFISKDAILHGALLSGLQGTAADLLGGVGSVIDILLPVLAFGAAVLTAFYMFRLIFLTFTGEPRDEEKFEHAHESPNSMVVPLVILAVFSTFFAVQMIPFSGSTYYESYLQKPERADAGSHKPHKEEHARATTNEASGDQPPTGTLTMTRSQMAGAGSSLLNVSVIPSVTAGPQVAEANGSSSHESEGHGGGHGELAHKAHNWTLILSLLVVVVGIGTAGLMYWAPMKMISPGSVSAFLHPLYILLERAYYFDELFYYGFVLPGIRFSRFLAGVIDIGFIDTLVDDVAYFIVSSSDYSGWMDNAIVDGLVNSTAEGVGDAGQFLRSSQTGNIRTYLGFIAGSILVLAGLLIGFTELSWGGPFEDFRTWFSQIIYTSGGAAMLVLLTGAFLIFLTNFGTVFYDWIRIGFRENL